MMSEGKKSRLFIYGTLEPKDHDLDEVSFFPASGLLLGEKMSLPLLAHTYYTCAQRLEKCYSDLSGVMGRLRENELFNHLNDKVRVNLVKCIKCIL